MLWLTLTLLFSLVLPTTVRAAEYYASTGGSGSTCSIGSPCTIPGGIAKLSGGDTLHIRGGDYSDLEIGNAIPSGSAGARTLITGYQAETVNLLRSKITMDGSSSNQYITFQNFNIDCQTTNCWIRLVNPVNNIRFNHVNIGNSTTSSTGAGMITGNAAYIEYLHMKIYNAGAGNCSTYANQGCYGFYVNGHHLLFDDIEVYDHGGTGLVIYHSGFTDVHDNVVRNSKFYNNGYNDARGYAGNGFILTSGDNNVAYNNVLWGNNGTAISVNYSCNNCAVYNNTVVSNGTTGNGYGIEVDNSSGVIVRNNISYKNGNGSVGQQLVDWAGNLTQDHNLLATNPNFSNEGGHDYTLQPGSPAIDQGVAVAMVTTDQAGTARPQPPSGAYDIGAYERAQGTPPPVTLTAYYTDKNGLGGPCNNSNSGAINSPVCTIQAGIGKLTAGSTLYIRAGTYNETINPAAYTLPTGTAANPIVIAGYQSEVVTITNGIILQDNVNSSIVAYLIFDHLTVRNNGDPAFRIAGNSHHIKIQNSDLQTFATSQTQQNAPNVVQITQTAWYNEVINCDVHDAPVSFDLGVTLGHYGFYVGGQYNTYDGNRIYNNTGYGINLFQSGSSQVSNNIVRNNTLYGNCYDDGNRRNSANAIIIGSGSDNQLYNNVIYNNTCTGAGAAVSIGYTNGGTNNQVYNNTIYNNNGPGIQIDATAPGTIVKNNIIYNNGGPPIQDDASNTDKSHNLTTNPLFRDAGAGDFQLQPQSDAINTGTPLAAVPTDKAGVTRPQPANGNYDIGAYEFVQGGPTPPSGNPIYVRKTVGSPSNDCSAAENPATAKQTIADACQCMSIPGKVMLIEGNGNVYAEELDTLTCPLTGGNGPSYDTATRLEGYGTTLPILQSPVATSGITLYLRSTQDHYLHFKKLVVDAAFRAGNALIVNSTAHHVRFEQVSFTGSPFENALLIGASNIEMIDVFSSGAGTNGLGLAQGFTNFLCHRCHLFSNGAKGLEVRDAGTRTNITVRESESRNNTGDGVDLGASTGTLLQNLLVHSNGGMGIRVRGGSQSTRVYNSTVYSNTGNGIQCDAPATSTEITNNIAYNNAGGGANNIVNNCTANVSTNLTTNPLFVNPPTDLKLQDGSEGINRGTNLPSVTVDYDGNPRPLGPYDIGAYERDQGTPQLPPGPGILRVSTTNRRYMENPAGELVYLTGAYSWNFASTMPDAEVTAYLNYVVAHNQNYIRAPSQDYSGTAQSTTYFTTLAARVQQAASLGIYVGVNIFPLTAAPFNSQSFNDAYARALVRAVGSQPNVLYEIGNELNTVALDGGTIGAFVASMVTAINNEQALQGFAPRRMVGISDFLGEGVIAVSSPIVTFLLNSSADFIGPGFSAVGTDACDPLPDYAGQKVIIVDSDHITPYHCDHTWVWKSLMLGANPSILDGNAFYPDKVVPDNPDDTVGAALTFDAQERMGDTRTYALKLRLGQAVPHPELASTGYALAWPNNEYLVYQPTTGAFTVQLPAGPYTVEWFDPTARTTTTTTTTVASAGAISFTSPLDPSHDAVLFLKTGTAPPPEPDVTAFQQDGTQAESFF